MRARKERSLVSVLKNRVHFLYENEIQQVGGFHLYAQHIRFVSILLSSFFGSVLRSFFVYYVLLVIFSYNVLAISASFLVFPAFFVRSLKENEIQGNFVRSVGISIELKFPIIAIIQFRKSYSQFFACIVVKNVNESKNKLSSRSGSFILRHTHTHIQKILQRNLLYQFRSIFSIFIWCCCCCGYSFDFLFTLMHKQHHHRVNNIIHKQIYILSLTCVFSLVLQVRS